MISSMAWAQEANLTTAGSSGEKSDGRPQDERIVVANNPYLPDRAEEVLDYWFGYLPGPDYVPEDKIPIWFAETPRSESILRQRFGQDVAMARRGAYNSWRETPAGRLALILLLDLIPRQIYRDQAQAFASDPMARALVIEGMQEKQDQWLYPVERAFFYLPLEHAENPEIQKLSVDVYYRLLMEAPPGMKPFIRRFYEYALTHQQQIEKFGRFPARNAILDRETTPDELEYLKRNHLAN
jgi:uncharacterized protein (DUF924 family)